MLSNGETLGWEILLFEYKACLFCVGTRSSGDVMPPAGRILLKVIAWTLFFKRSLLLPAVFPTVLLFRLCGLTKRFWDLLSLSGSSTVTLTLDYGFANLVYRIKFSSLTHVSLYFIIKYLTCLESNKANVTFLISKDERVFIHYMMTWNLFLKH